MRSASSSRPASRSASWSTTRAERLLLGGHVDVERSGHHLLELGEQRLVDRGEVECRAASELLGERGRQRRAQRGVLVDRQQVQRHVLRRRLHEREPAVRVGAWLAERRDAVDRGPLEAVLVCREEPAQADLDLVELHDRRRHQYAASFRIASAILAGLSMNQSSSAWLYGTPGTSGPAIRVTGP